MYPLGRESPEEEAAKPSSGASGRKGSKKVRSGCITCKIRKVKCDEAKPYCVRCTKTGRKCDGYLDDAALAIRRRRRRRTITDSLGDHRAGDSEGLTAAASELITSASGSALSSLTPPLSVSTVPRSPGMVLWESAQEKQSFEFFQHITAPVLAGDLDAVFWRVLVLQICHTEPAVRHAVMAISSLHEALLSVSSEPATKTHNEGLAPVSPPSCRISTSQQQDFALQQYNKAISYLLEDIKASNEPDIKGTESTASLRRPVAPLMTCLLFVCIEVMQGKDRDALVHLEQGRRLLSQLPGGNIPSTFMPEQGTPTKGNDDPELAVIHKHLVPLYSRLSMTSFLFGGNPEPIPPALKTARTGRTTDSFDSIHSLRTAVHDFVDDVLRFVQRARPIKYPTPSPQRHSSPSSYASSRPPTSPSSSPPASPLSPSSLVSQSPPPSPSVDEGDIRQPSQIPQTSIAQYELETCRHALSAELGRLRVALSLFRVNQSAVVAASASPNSAALSLLQMHLCIAEVWLATATTRFETAYDAHVETFSTIVSLAVSALEAEQQQCQKRQQQQQQHAKYYRPCDPDSTASASVFTLETYVIPALYYVATKCRHGLVRHAALSLLLRNGGRRENLWRAGVLGAIARRIIEVEEGYVDAKAEDVEMEADGNHENTVKEEDSHRATFANTGWTEWHGHEAYPHPDLRLNSKPIFAADHDTPMQSAFDNWGADNTFGFDDTEPETRGSWQESVTDIDERTEEHRQMPVKISASSLSSTPCVSSSAANAVPNSSNQRSMEAPFDIPEQARVHTAVIGPDEDKGRWVTLFRKPQGPEGAWDIRAEFVAS